MDDPIFEPWSIESQRPRPSKPRWRSPADSVPTRPRPAPQRQRTQPDLGDVPERPIEDGSALLQALATLERVARQLRLARHSVELEYEPPSVRMRVHPWQGPLRDAPAPPGGIIEIEEASDDGGLTVRYALDGSPATAAEVEVPSGQALPSALDPLVVAFARRVFETAAAFDG